MFLAMGSTSSVTHTAGSSGPGVSADPNALVVLVNTKEDRPADTPSSSRTRVAVMLVSMKSWSPWVAM